MASLFELRTLPRLDRVSPYQIASDLSLPVGRDSVEPSASKLIEDALVCPIVRLFHQTRTDWVGSNVIPFLGVAFLPPQTMVKSIRLQARRALP